MNPVEIEDAVSRLSERPFDAQGFPYAFLEAFGNKGTTIERLRSGKSNKSDLGGVLQTNNIHIKVCHWGKITDTLVSLKQSPATARARAKFVLATDGEWLEAENLSTGVTGGKVEQRIANARFDATFLLADVELVATYELYNINRTRLENLIHRVFDSARLDIGIADRFGHPVEPREWFLVPLAVIDEAIERIKNTSIKSYLYHPQHARLVTREGRMSNPISPVRHVPLDEAAKAGSRQNGDNHE